MSRSLPGAGSMNLGGFKAGKISENQTEQQDRVWGLHQDIFEIGNVGSHCRVWEALDP